MGFDRNAASDQAFGHKPVLLEECLTALNIKSDGIYVDGTLGRAGHSLEIVKKLTGNGRLICLDRDETAIEAAKIRLADYLDRVTLVHSNFSRIAEVLHQLDIPGVDGMLFDLGVSSPQLDEAQRVWREAVQQTGCGLHLFQKEKDEALSSRLIDPYTLSEQGSALYAALMRTKPYLTAAFQQSGLYGCNLH